MARKVAVEVYCERCSRKEMQELPENGVQEMPPVFTAKLQPLGEKALEVKFGDLCGPCQRAVTGLFEQIAKKIDGLSPDRGTKKEAEPKAETKPDEQKAKKEEPTPNGAGPRSQAAAKAPTPPRSS